MAYRIVVLASGTGSLFQSLIDAVADGTLEVQIAGLVTDRGEAQALQRAATAGIPTAVVPLAKGADRDEWNRALCRAVEEFAPDLVVSAGFMRIVGPAFLQRFGGAMINTHPSLLPSFPGAHAVRDALAHGVRVSGATIFWVDEGVDTGRIIDQAAVPVQTDDTADSLHERIKTIERQILIDTVGRLAEEENHEQRPV
ncbi:phosphoribosylglycinamide formyltransferase [Naumannella halotolerans]|uniref:Phosphoribosylglycinamide formyltransferase n=1 Tax=Naumannella halotolerans TaxID=993414 RepID=A0A4R7JCJ8_9ACTN|nr:phosphoribosylglycinamide formyltransferase [Naumannella halotolerans]TDT34189.1 phosphoribosylglycinamide formyltransferase-1 [Naumannella halotolerans]